MTFLSKALDQLRPRRTRNRQEKRREDRAAHECWAHVRCIQNDPQDLAGRHSLGLSQDISSGGIRVQCFRQIPLKAEVRINLECPRADQAIHIDGAVVWVAPVEHQPGHWTMGIEFSDLDGSTQRMISQLVEQARRRDFHAEPATPGPASARF
ncbi:MAG: hypothetical protein GVY22_06775 [Gammaproteobacteria bacterium]|nr:hypothetical protein [Gammaproteobacteria bacterium]